MATWDSDVIFRILPTDVSLQPYEIEWLDSFGVPQTAIADLPINMIREIYEDILSHGPNMDAVTAWMELVTEQATQGEFDKVVHGKFNIWQLQSEPFGRYVKQSSQFATDRVLLLKGETDRKDRMAAMTRLKETADVFASKLAKQTAYNLPTNFTASSVETYENGLYHALRFSMRSISEAGIYSQFDKLESLRSVVEAETRLQAGMEPA